MVEGDGIKLFLRVDAREFYMDASLLPRSICRVLTNKNRLQFYIRPVVQAYPAGPDGIR